MENNNKKENFKKYNFENFNQTTEEDVGIIEFVNKKDEEFECVLKHRYSDFLVNEISENGDVIWLKIKSEAKNTMEQSNDQNEETLKIEDQTPTEKSIAGKVDKISNQNYKEQSNNKNKLVLSPEMVENIIKNYFVGKQIMDEEDGQRLKELIVKYIERYKIFL